MTVTGFFTDSTVCIGCKACEVACKEWNDVPHDGFAWSGNSYDNTRSLGASTWRHVKFVEREPEIGRGGNAAEKMAWEFSSDVCKHCENAGRAFKCTFCYDRQKAGLEPACAKACPTGSILFGDLEKLERVADERIARLHAMGMEDAAIWNPKDTSVGGTHAFFLVRGDARAYNLPQNPVMPTAHLKDAWTSAAIGAAAIAVSSLLAFALGGRRK